METSCGYMVKATAANRLRGRPARRDHCRCPAMCRPRLAPRFNLGWTDRNVRMDLRWAGSDVNRIRALAQELVGQQPDIIVTSGGVATAALQRETRTIPIVFVTAGDPVASGIVISLNQPGENIAGFANSLGGGSPLDVSAMPVRPSRRCRSSRSTAGYCGPGRGTEWLVSACTAAACNWRSPRSPPVDEPADT
jgi:hypothetical protein